MVTSTALPPKSPMSSAGGQSKKKSPFKMLTGRASPFRKRFGSADKVGTSAPGVEEENRVETPAAEGDRDIFEEERDMYDPIDAEESHTLNTLSGSESLDTDGETDNDESFTVDYESRCETVDTFGESTIAQDTMAHEEEADEHLPPEEGKVFTQSVVLTKLDAASLESGDGLVLRAQHRDMKPEQDNHAFINVRASSVSPSDVLKCRGAGLSQENLPYIPGRVVVGTIESLGSEVKLPFQVGDRVVGLVESGGNSRFLSTDAENLVKASPSIKNSDAACLVEDYMTAYRALRVARTSFKGAALFGMNIFITDGYSPVGQAVIQLANLEGANIYCCAKKSHHSYLKSISRRVNCFSTQREAWLPLVLEKMDIVIDNTCADGYNSSWQALNETGILVGLPAINMGYSETLCGVLDVDDMLRQFSQMKAKYTMSQTVFLDLHQDFDKNREEFARDLMYLMYLSEQGKIKPKVAEKVALDDVGDAQKLIANYKNNGTVVCMPWKKCG